jgi:hypothetical protein
LAPSVPKTSRSSRGSGRVTASRSVRNEPLTAGVYRDERWRRRGSGRHANPPPVLILDQFQKAGQTSGPCRRLQTSSACSQRGHAGDRTRHGAVGAVCHCPCQYVREDRSRVSVTDAALRPVARQTFATAHEHAETARYPAGDPPQRASYQVRTGCSPACGAEERPRTQLRNPQLKIPGRGDQGSGAVALSGILRTRGPGPSWSHATPKHYGARGEPGRRCETWHSTPATDSRPGQQNETDRQDRHRGESSTSQHRMDQHAADTAMRLRRSSHSTPLRSSVTTTSPWFGGGGSVTMASSLIRDETLRSPQRSALSG